MTKASSAGRVVLMVGCSLIGGYACNAPKCPEQELYLPSATYAVVEGPELLKGRAEVVIDGDEIHIEYLDDDGTATVVVYEYSPRE